MRGQSRASLVQLSPGSAGGSDGVQHLPQPQLGSAPAAGRTGQERFVPPALGSAPLPSGCSGCQGAGAGRRDTILGWAPKLRSSSLPPLIQLHGDMASREPLPHISHCANHAGKGFSCPRLTVSARSRAPDSHPSSDPSSPRGQRSSRETSAAYLGALRCCLAALAGAGPTVQPAPPGRGEAQGPAAGCLPGADTRQWSSSFGTGPCSASEACAEGWGQGWWPRWSTGGH